MCLDAAGASVGDPIKGQYCEDDDDCDDGNTCDTTYKICCATGKTNHLLLTQVINDRDIRLFSTHKRFNFVLVDLLFGTKVMVSDGKAIDNIYRARETVLSWS